MGATGIGFIYYVFSCCCEINAERIHTCSSCSSVGSSMVCTPSTCVYLFTRSIFWGVTFQVFYIILSSLFLELSLYKGACFFCLCGSKASRVKRVVVLVTESLFV
ncbi:unnamed protein product [Pylaiella littoralis]